MSVIWLKIYWWVGRRTLGYYDDDDDDHGALNLP